MQNIKHQKDEIRRLYIGKRRSMTPHERMAGDEAVFRAAMELIDELRPQRILSYVSSPTVEVDTRRIITSALAMGIEVAVPLCEDKNGHMDFFRISSLSQLRRGFYGIDEPDRDTAEKITAESGDLCIVPGIAYSQQGYRVGFGRGYYDRFLAGFPGVSAGLCYESCICPELVHEDFDIRVDMIITESGVHKAVGI